MFLEESRVGVEGTRMPGTLSPETGPLRAVCGALSLPGVGGQAHIQPGL